MIDCERTLVILTCEGLRRALLVEEGAAFL